MAPWMSSSPPARCVPPWRRRIVLASEHIAARLSEHRLRVRRRGARTQLPLTADCGWMARLAAGVVRLDALTSSPERDRVAALGFYALAVLLTYLVYQLFLPFLTPLAWAGVLAICFYPTHQRFERRMRRGLAAFVSTASVALL